MENNYNLNQLVKYNGKIYRIVEAHTMNFFLADDPVVYGLVIANKKPSPERKDRIYVRGALIEPLTEKEQQTWRLLHGKL